ncbi:hypothetical protein BDR03DRAFT_1016148 [Suillus americanus]|nr:hypothetical protein BDR03DRAFT_1016148 [Suillus americanus]
MSLSSEDDDSDRVLKSSYGGSIHKDPDDSDIDVATPSPIEDSSQDEYIVTPTKNETSSITYSTPTSRSRRSERCSTRTRAEFHQMCRTIYKGQFCLITRDDEALEVAHVIPVATKGRRVCSSMTHEKHIPNISSVKALRILPWLRSQKLAS